MRLRPRSLYGKLAAVLIGLLAALGALFALVNLSTTQLFMQELNQRFNRDLARELLVQREMGGEGLLDESHVHELFSFYMHINPAIEIYLLDPSGDILAFEAPQMKIKREQVDIAPIRRFLSGDSAYPILGDDPRDSHRQKVFTAAAIPAQGPPQQYLYIVLAGEDYDNLQMLLHDSYFLQQGIAVVIASLLFGLLAGLYAFNLLTARLGRLARLMEDFRSGGFRQHEPYGPARGEADEIDRLGESFDAMADTIGKQMRALEEKDQLRRNLVANVSHDLRTPLAALKGYIETLMVKSGEFDTETRHHYLGIAYQQSERLTRLVEELFDLSKLDARESLPQSEPLGLGELLFDVAHKYRPIAAERSIKLSEQIATELPLVRGDTGLINRVLENLIANAIEHASEGGYIRLSAETVDAGVRVTMENSGEIAKDDLPLLFERFYQSPERRGSSGAGLGLAIVKRILELHDSEIVVTSGEGKSRFEFTLKIWQ